MIPITKLRLLKQSRLHVRQAAKCRSLLPLVGKEEPRRLLVALADELEQRATELMERARTAPNEALKVRSVVAAGGNELSLGVSEIGDGERVLAARMRSED